MRIALTLRDSDGAEDKTMSGYELPDKVRARMERQSSRMVNEQIFMRGIRDPQILQAMRDVPREAFVPINLRDQAFEDRPLPIGFGQTISQPYTVAFMVNALRLKSTDRVLEIGTGCGYAAAVLSHIAAEVHTIERLSELADQAQQRLAELGYSRVTVHCGDGTLGLPQNAPYDAIIVAAGSDSLPQALAEQLAEGGRTLIPIGDTQDRQVMYRFTRQGGSLVREDLGNFAFVPLIGECGWGES